MAVAVEAVLRGMHLAGCGLSEVTLLVRGECVELWSDVDQQVAQAEDKALYIFRSGRIPVRLTLLQGGEPLLNKG